MDYEDLIDEETDPVEPTPEAELEDKPVEPRAKSPWKAFIVTGIIASLFGAAGGGYGVYEGFKRLGPKSAERPVMDIAPLESKIGDLTTRMSAAEAVVKKAANRPVPEMKPVDLSPLEKRLEALEAAPDPEIDPEALTALQSAQADGFEWPDTSALEGRLATLESTFESAPEPVDIPADLLERLDAMESRVQTNVESASEGNGTSEQELSILSERFDLIESRLAVLESQPVATPRIERVALLAFPKSAMVGAAEATVEGGIVKRALSKHIGVKDEDAPLTLIDGIEADIAEGRLEDAVKKFDRLPEPVRAAGQAWYNSVKASL